MITIGYARVSTRGQAERGLSMEAQAKGLRAYCELYHLDLVEIIEDRGVSAKNVKDRPGMLALLDRIREKKADAVVVYKMDRMFRSIRDALDVLDEFKARGVAFHSVDERWDTSTAIGEFAMNMVMAVAQLERKQIGERTKGAMRAMKQSPDNKTLINASKMRSGKLMVGVAPYGYRWVRKKLVIHPDEMPVALRIRSMKSEGLGTRVIATILKKEMVLNRRGEHFDPSNLRRIFNADYYEVQTVAGTESVGARTQAGEVHHT